MCTAAAHGPARLYVSQPLLSDKCPPNCSTGNLALAGCAQAVPYMAIAPVANTFSVTSCVVMMVAPIGQMRSGKVRRLV